MPFFQLVDSVPNRHAHIGLICPTPTFSYFEGAKLLVRPALYEALRAICQQTPVPCLNSDHQDFYSEVWPQGSTTN